MNLYTKQIRYEAVMIIINIPKCIILIIIIKQNQIKLIITLFLAVYNQVTTIFYGTKKKRNSVANVTYFLYLSFTICHKII